MNYQIIASDLYDSYINKFGFPPHESNTFSNFNTWLDWTIHGMEASGKIITEELFTQCMLQYLENIRYAKISGINLT